jgi:hypothetical protein
LTFLIFNRKENQKETAAIENIIAESDEERIAAPLSMIVYE